MPIRVFFTNENPVSRVSIYVTSHLSYTNLPQTGGGEDVWFIPLHYSGRLPLGGEIQNVFMGIII